LYSWLSWAETSIQEKESEIMKAFLGAAFVAAPIAAAVAAPPNIVPFPCPACPVQSKVASAKTAGQYDYKLKCVDAETHNSAVINVTAPNDVEAIHIAWKSPRLDEVIVGMEANSYMCAEPPSRSTK
jgi:hypothetical protein